MTADEVATLRDVMLDAHGSQSIEIRRNSTTLDAYGHPDGSTLVATVDAVIIPVSGSERWRERQAQAITSWVVMSSYAAGIAPADWIVYGARKLWIVSVLDVGAVGEMLQFQCSESPQEP